MVYDDFMSIENHRAKEKRPWESTTILGRVVDKLIPTRVFGGLPFDLQREGIKAIRSYQKMLEEGVDNPAEAKLVKQQFREWQQKFDGYQARSKSGR